MGSFNDFSRLCRICQVQVCESFFRWEFSFFESILLEEPLATNFHVCETTGFGSREVTIAQYSKALQWSTFIRIHIVRWRYLYRMKDDLFCLLKIFCTVTTTPVTLLTADRARLWKMSLKCLHTKEAHQV